MASPREYFGREPDESGVLSHRQFAEQFEPGEDDRWSRTAERVRGTPRYRAIVEDIKRQGVTEPVSVHNTWVANGHHRVVAAMDAGRPIPYEHWRDDE